jgi:hypothetical protein
MVNESNRSGREPEKPKKKSLFSNRWTIMENLKKRTWCAVAGIWDVGCGSFTKS